MPLKQKEHGKNKLPAELKGSSDSEWPLNGAGDASWLGLGLREAAAESDGRSSEG